MSHFTRVRTALRDADVLAAALKELGLSPVEVHDRPQQLRGYGGATERADVIVRRENLRSALADLGFARRGDGSYEIVIDDVDQRRLGGERWLTALTRSYSHAATLKYAATHGFEVSTDEVEQDGTRRLTLRRVR